MKTLLTAAILANGLFLSTLALSDEAQPTTNGAGSAETSAPTDATTAAPKDAPAAATTTTDSAKKMTKAEAEKACKDEGKTAAHLKACVKEKMGN